MSPRAASKKTQVFLRVAVVAVFLVGLVVTIRALRGPRLVAPGTFVQMDRWRPHPSRGYLETDEKIYLALVEQLQEGRGYNLIGHPVLDSGLDRDQYGRTLFFHPPAGIVAFWAFSNVLGPSGWAFVQVLSFSIFFWSMVSIGRNVTKPSNALAMLALGVAAAFTPIMAHVVTRLWLDGPLLACCTLAIATFLAAQERQSMRLAGVAGGLLGIASLIKATAFLVMPGAVLLAVTMFPVERLRAVGRLAAAFAIVAVALHLPWLLWQWTVFGTPFVGWAGKPTDDMIRTNSYVRLLTETRPAWSYFELLPQIIWTLIPSLVIVVFGHSKDLRRRGAALTAWIAIVVGAHVILGTIGYSKVMRYVVLVTPATTALFMLAVQGLTDDWKNSQSRRRRRTVLIALSAVAVLSLSLEIGQSMTTRFIDNERSDLIRPLFGTRLLPW